MRALRTRVAGIGQARGDLLLALAIGLLLEIETLTAGRHSATSLALIALASALLVAPVAFRGRRPRIALVAGAGLATAQQALGGDLGSTSGVGLLLALAVLAYSAGAWLALRAALSSLLLGAALFAGFVLQIESGVSPALGATALVLVAPWAAGRLVRERTSRADAFRALAEQTEREQAERERAAIAHERLRIGAELQDIVAHSVSAMVIGAAGARRLMHCEPDRARESIRTVEQTGRQTLADMRRLLGVLRREEDPRELAPQPGLAQLPALAAAVNGGMHCEVRTHGETSDLTPGMDLVGYRVIEAAVACAARHSAKRAQIDIGFERDGLRLEVSAECSAPDAPEELRAISERVALYGGSFELGQQRPRLEVRVRLPFAAVLAA